jgi:hypothetical protein
MDAFKKAFEEKIIEKIADKAWKKFFTKGDDFDFYVITKFIIECYKEEEI